jgi:hypothetical protein
MSNGFYTWGVVCVVVPRGESEGDVWLKVLN